MLQNHRDSVTIKKIFSAIRRSRLDRQERRRQRAYRNHGGQPLYPRARSERIQHHYTRRYGSLAAAVQALMVLRYFPTAESLPSCAILSQAARRTPTVHLHEPLMCACTRRQYTNIRGLVWVSRRKRGRQRRWKRMKEREKHASHLARRTCSPVSKPNIVLNRVLQPENISPEDL